MKEIRDLHPLPPNPGMAFGSGGTDASLVAKAHMSVGKAHEKLKDLPRPSEKVGKGGGSVGPPKRGESTSPHPAGS